MPPTYEELRRTWDPWSFIPPAYNLGVDLTAGEHADATSDGGPHRPDEAEPDLRDAAAGPRQVDLDAES